MAYGYPYPMPNYFNTNYMPPQQPQAFSQPSQPPQQMQPANPSPALQRVPDELTARNATFPMDGSKAYFVNEAAGEIYTKQLSMADGTLIFEKYTKASSTAPEYVTQQQMTEFEDRIYRIIGGRRNDESTDAYADDAGRRKSNAVSADVRRAKPASSTGNADDSGQKP